MAVGPIEEKHLVGKVIVTTDQQKATTGSRERSLRLEKTE